MRSNYAGLALVFAEKRDCHEVWRKGLEGWNVEESLIVKEWQQKAFEKGREEGRTVALRDALIQLVKVRLKCELPPDLLGALESEKDLSRLSGWVESVGTASSLEQVQEAILGHRANGS